MPIEEESAAGCESLNAATRIAIMKIRPATSNDEEQIFRLARDLATSFEVTREAFSASFRDVLAANACEVLVAESEGCVVGYVFGLHHPAFYANGNVSWVQEIFVE